MAFNKNAFGFDRVGFDMSSFYFGVYQIGEV